MYFARISAKPSGAAATSPWILLNTGSRTCRIARIYGCAVFSGATSANALLGFEFVRTVSTDLTDGTAAAVLVGRMNSSHAAATMEGLYLAAGVSFTASSTDTCGPLTVYVPQVQGAVVGFDYPGGDSSPFTGAPPGAKVMHIAPGQGIIMRLIEASATGLGIAGAVEWTEV